MSAGCKGPQVFIPTDKNYETSDPVHILNIQFCPVDSGSLASQVMLVPTSKRTVWRCIIRALCWPTGTMPPVEAGVAGCVKEMHRLHFLFPIAVLMHDPFACSITILKTGTSCQ